MFDLHNDLLTCGAQEKEIRDIIDGVEKSGGKMLCAVFTRNVKEEDLTTYMKYYNNSVIPAVEDCGFLDNFDYLGNFAPFYASLTWNYDNKYAGGALEGGKLTDKGRELIDYLNEKGIVLDTAHLSKNSFFEAAERAEKVMNSHTCFSAVREHFRNIDDEQIRAIVNKGGVIGLTLFKDFVSDKKTASYDDLYRQIDHFCSVFGHKNLCFGTDYWGCDETVEGLSRYEDFGNFAEFLQNKGFGKEAINDIFFANAERFYGKVSFEKARLE